MCVSHVAGYGESASDGGITDLQGIDRYIHCPNSRARSNVKNFLYQKVSHGFSSLRIGELGAALTPILSPRGA